MADFDYDLFVIGGGSGGTRAARVAAAGGARVALAEEDRYGGTCVIRGCVPKKLMVFASTYSEAFAEARDYGWEVTSGAFQWDWFKTKLERELDRLEGIYQRLLDNSGVERFSQRAIVTGAHGIELADGTAKTAKTILVATGGHPVVPDMPGAELGITSNEIFHLDELPKKMLIIGGGYIACEFAGIMTGLGVEVCQWYRGAQILRGFDDEARGAIADGMRRRGVDLHTGTNIMELKRAADHDPDMDSVPIKDRTNYVPPYEGPRGKAGPMWVKSTTGAEMVFDQVLFATGRTPNTDGLGLASAGAEIGRRGEVIVDEYSRTATPSIYAIGDVTNRIQLTPVAIREGMAFVETVFNDTPTPVDHDLVPSAVFTQPEFGTVGMTEEEARDQEAIEIYATSFRAMRQAFAGKDERVLMKLIVSQATRKVLGCHIVADGAGEMIQLAGIAVKMGATKEDFDRVCAVHPTMSEELVTMKTPVRTA
ncbi:MAG: FAD-dependent oxidoreductase [Pseudomonadota bacterium]